MSYPGKSLQLTLGTKSFVEGSEFVVKPNKLRVMDPMALSLRHRLPH